jgi:hypothetical protein
VSKSAAGVSWGRGSKGDDGGAGGGARRISADGAQ